MVCLLPINAEFQAVHSYIRIYLLDFPLVSSKAGIISISCLPAGDISSVKPIRPFDGIRPLPWLGLMVGTAGSGNCISGK